MKDSDKVLRSRFKKWGIDDKNKRKGQEAFSAIGIKSRITSGEDEGSNSTECNVDIHGKTSLVRRRDSQPVSTRPHQSKVTPGNTTPQTTATRDTIQTGGAETNIIGMLRNTKEQLQTQRILSAVGNWCEALASPKLRPRSGFTMNCPMIELSSDLHSALLTMQKSGTSAGWELLQSAGSKAHRALQYQHPGTIPELLLFLSHLRDLFQRCTEVQKPIMAVLKLLRCLSQGHLGYEHPASLIITAFLQGRLSRDLCDELFVAIDLNYTSKLSQKYGRYVRSRLMLTLGWMHHIQRRYNELEVLLAELVRGLTSSTADAYQEAEAYRILAKSRSTRGRLAEANMLLARAWKVLERAGLERSGTAHHLLLDLAEGKRVAGDLEFSEQLLLQVLLIEEERKRKLDMDLSYILYLLRDVYLEQGKDESAVELATRYPDSLK